MRPGPGLGRCRAWPLTLALAGCGLGGATTSPSPSTALTTPSPTRAPTPTTGAVSPVSGTVLTGIAWTDAPPETSPQPSPSGTASTPTAAGWAPTVWRADVHISAGDLPGAGSCEADFTEASAPTALGCEGCDVVWTVTRTLTSSDGLCVWPPTERLDVALHLAAGRIDRRVPAETEGGVDTWSPWYLLTAVEALPDPESGQPALRITLQGHPAAGFQQPL